MATLNRLTRRVRGESLRGAFMVDTVRGVLRVRKWPRKRGTPRSPLQRWWNDWFRQANKLAKYVDGATAARAIEITAGSGMYPRDIILSAMRGRLYSWVDQYGKVWNSMAALQDISDSLDVLSQIVGSVLVRAGDRWRPPDPGNVNDVLTYKGSALAPVWQPTSGGVGQGDVPGSPITPDNTVSEYVFDVSGEFNVNFIFEGVGFPSSDRVWFRMSIDGGLTYKSGAADYRVLWLTKDTQGGGTTSVCLAATLPSANPANINMSFQNLRSGYPTYTAFAEAAGLLTVYRNGWAMFGGAITHIKAYSAGGANFNAGTIRCIGLH